jgi:biotin carboxylase
VRTPEFSIHPLDAPPPEMRFPCVCKPLLLSTSRGVIRANNAEELAVAWQRIGALLARPAFAAVQDPDGHRILIEDFVPGPEVALEGIVDAGRFIPLALFDKPDPLDGPFFEETIYVTPSRHAPALQTEIAKTTEAAARAMGLRDGPVHAELRLAADGPTVIEMAARSIGGLCARTLRFGIGQRSLEEIILKQALGGGVDAPVLEGAAGVMMIPIRQAGVLMEVSGVADAKKIALIEDVVITVERGRMIEPPPEGGAYLGFIFARGAAPADVEAALRRAHSLLSFTFAHNLTA